MNPIWDNIFKQNPREKTIDQAIKKNIMFDELSNAGLKFVRSIVHIRTYAAGEKVFLQGEVGAGMYIIAKGKVDILSEKLDPATGESQSQLVAQLTENDFFGEIALVIDDGRRSATAVAVEETDLIGFFKSDLYEIIDRSPAIGVKILWGVTRVLGRRLTETTAIIQKIHKENAR